MRNLLILNTSLRAHSEEWRPSPVRLASAALQLRVKRIRRIIVTAVKISRPFTGKVGISQPKSARLLIRVVRSWCWIVFRDGPPSASYQDTHGRFCRQTSLDDGSSLSAIGSPECCPDEKESSPRDGPPLRSLWGIGRPIASPSLLNAVEWFDRFVPTFSCRC